MGNTVIRTVFRRNDEQVTVDQRQEPTNFVPPAQTELYQSVKVATNNNTHLYFAKPRLSKNGRPVTDQRLPESARKFYKKMEEGEIFDPEASIDLQGDCIEQIRR